MSGGSSLLENMDSGRMPCLDKMLNLPRLLCRGESTAGTGSTVGRGSFPHPPLGSEGFPLQ